MPHQYLSLVPCHYENSRFPARALYDIEIESGLLGIFDTSFLPHEIAVLSNETVAPLYAQPLATRLRENGRRVLEFNAPEGEGAKNLDWTNRAYDALAEWGL